MQNQRNSGNQLWTILKLLNWTTSYFKTHRIDSPRATAEILLAHTLKVERIDLYLRFEQPLSRDELTGFKALIKRRIDHEPVAYIVGHKEFWALDLIVSPDVLIPRPETECLVETVLALDHRNGQQHSKKVLELGTGSGAIILALASERANDLFYASDISSQALALAKKNARRLGWSDRIHFFAGDWFAPLKRGHQLYDMIVSNPPYIGTSTLNRLQPEIHLWEPRLALDGDRDGLRCLQHIIAQAHRFLVTGGYLVLEIGHDQKTLVHDVITSCNQYDQLAFKRDYGGHDRVAIMRKKKVART